MGKKKKNWKYAQAETRKCGTMICTHCKQPISSGDYRYYETEEAFHCQHRACSEQDLTWAMLDKRVVEHIAGLRQKLDEYKTFRDRWDEVALNDEIESLERYFDGA